MLFYVRTGEVNVCHDANSPKEAAVAVIKISKKRLGKIIVVGKGENDEEELFFLTHTLLAELEKTTFRLIGD